MSAIERAFTHHPQLTIEDSVVDHASLASADVMISDYSGAALEFAFAHERPVLFIDVPRKVNNPEHEKIGCEPLEVSIRDKIGRVVASEDLANLPVHVQAICDQADHYRDRIRRLRLDSVYNLGHSGLVAAEAIAAIADAAAVEPGEVHELCGIGH
jgi:YidC/Oxa1 family membrane protein insertase